MFHIMSLTLCLLAASIAQGASVPATTVMLQASEVVPNLPAWTLSEAGVGSDGHTTYVGSYSKSNGEAGLRTYALGPNDYVDYGLQVDDESHTLVGIESCTFAGGATAGAVGACALVVPDPTTPFTISVTETLVSSSIPFIPMTSAAASVFSSAAPVASNTAPVSSNSVPAASGAPASLKTNGATSGVRVGFLLSVVLGVAVMTL